MNQTIGHIGALCTCRKATSESERIEFFVKDTMQSASVKTAKIQEFNKAIELEKMMDKYRKQISLTDAEKIEFEYLCKSKWGNG